MRMQSPIVDTGSNLKPSRVTLNEPSTEGRQAQSCADNAFVNASIESAYELHQAGRHADAARVYDGLLQQNPDDAAALHLFGILHHQGGHHSRACELIQRAIAIRPEIAAFHANLGEVLRAMGQFEQAATACHAALKLKPEYPEALNNLGLSLHEMGRHDEALTHLDSALKLKPHFAMAMNNRGSALRELKQTKEAIEAYRRAIELDPKLAKSHANLGQLLADDGHLIEGLAHCREAVKHQPDLPAAHNNLGNVLRELERWDEAGEAYSEAVRLQPDLAIAHANLALMYRRVNRPGLALPHLQKAAELSPDDPAVLGQLAAAHVFIQNWSEAIPPCERRVELKLEDPQIHCDLGWAYQGDGRHADAETCYRRALELNPNHLNALLNLGSLHEEVGAMADAEASFLAAEQRHPKSPMPLSHRATLVRGRLSDSDRDRLRAELYKTCPPNVRMNLLFALAQVADGRSDYAESAACLEPANAMAKLSRWGNEYDPDRQSKYVDRLINAFTPQQFKRFEGAGNDTARPVFVFGMPRSGTTLVEQILSSHSRVHGAGELPLMHQAMDQISTKAEAPKDGSSDFESVTDELLQKLARDYQDGVQKLLDRRPGDWVPERVVDKMPDNYSAVGLIAMLFPKATLIHVRRDARDVAVSCWMTHFAAIRWADDMDHLARRITDYQRLTNHWQSVLSRPIYEVSYERLVENFEPEARQLFEFCGLEWEPGCSNFHQTSRPVRTASVTQVRQPLYSRSVARWKNYEPYLGKLFETDQRKRANPDVS